MPGHFSSKQASQRGESRKRSIKRGRSRRRSSKLWQKLLLAKVVQYNTGSRYKCVYKVTLLRAIQPNCFIHERKKESNAYIVKSIFRL